MTADARLDATAGPGSTLVPDLGTGHAVVDATAGTLTRDGFVTLRWTGFDGFGFSGTAGATGVPFDGSDRAESIYVSFPTEASRRQRWYLGGGDDTLLSPDGAGGRRASTSAGPGDDHVDLWAGTRLDLDLASGRMGCARTAARLKERFATIETSRRCEEAAACAARRRPTSSASTPARPTVRGRAGKDASPPPAPATTATCSTATPGSRGSDLRRRRPGHHQGSRARTCWSAARAATR